MKYLYIIILLIVISSDMMAHSPKLGGISISARPLISNKYLNYGTDMNIMLFLVNAGLAFDYCTQNETVNTSLFFGLGVFNAFQIQYGFDSQDKYIRLRLEPAPFQNGGLWWDSFDEEFKRRINILVIIDFNINEFKNSRLGVGASLLIL